MTNSLTLFFFACVLLPSSAPHSQEITQQDHMIARGQYLTDVAGCKYCHTNDKGGNFAGGRSIKSHFGTFYSPNITSDKETGIGLWTYDSFERAMRQGISPNGQHYYPIFPYSNYQNLTASDIEAIYRYLLTTTPHKTVPQQHDVGFPFSIRPLISMWKWAYLEQGKMPEATISEKDKNGQYLVYAVTHCDQCHSPRSIFGGIDIDRRMAGGAYKGDESYAPSLLKSEDALREWSASDLETYLLLGEEPSGDYAAGDMTIVIDHMTNYLTDKDMQQLIEFLLSQ